MKSARGIGIWLALGVLVALAVWSIWEYPRHANRRVASIESHRPTLDFLTAKDLDGEFRWYAPPRFTPTDSDDVPEIFFQRMEFELIPLRETTKANNPRTEVPGRESAPLIVA